MSERFLVQKIVQSSLTSVFFKNGEASPGHTKVLGG